MKCRRIVGLLPLLALTLASCRGVAPVGGVGSGAGAPQDWLCKPAPDGGWVCMREAASTAVPTARRLAGPASAAKAESPANGGAVRDVPLPRLGRAERFSANSAGLAAAPATHYAVQLIAFGTEQALREFMAERELADMTPVRVENSGRLHFALLAGIYPDRAAADRAVAALAPALRALEPWVRSVGNLRAAIARANRLADAAP